MNNGTLPNAVTAKQIVRNRGVWLEIGAVLFLISAPSLAHLSGQLLWGSKYSLFQENRRKDERPARKEKRAAHKKESSAQKDEIDPAKASDFSSFDSMLLRLRFAPILLIVMWRSGHRWSRFGIVKPRPGKDLLMGLVLWLYLAGVDTLVFLATQSNRSWSPFDWSRSYFDAVPAARMLIIAGKCCVIGFTEELAFRGYLIARVEELTKSTWLAVVCSVAMFTFVHLQKSDAGLLHTFAAGAIWSVAFCATRRIWPLAISHALLDFVVEMHQAAA